MNIKLQRLNEARKYVKKIRAKYGQHAEICDLGNEWSIYTSLRIAGGMFGFNSEQDRVHWRGKFLRDSL
jgi:hypothetical protein